MAVSLDMVRTQIRDQARPCVSPGKWELIAAPADGVAMTFPLRYRNAILPSLQIGIAATGSGTSAPPPYINAPTGWSAAADAYGQPSVTFATTPTAGETIGARYLVTGFTDLELTNYLGQNVRSSDSLTLKAVHVALIPVVLADRDLSMLFRLGDRVDDPSQWQRTQLELLKSLKADLDQEPGEDPEGSIGGGRFGFGRFFA